MAKEQSPQLRAVGSSDNVPEPEFRALHENGDRSVPLGRAKDERRESKSSVWLCTYVVWGWVWGDFPAEWPLISIY